jgi:hypothetical protein
MSQDVEKAMSDLKSKLSFGGGGGRGGGGGGGRGPSWERTGRQPSGSNQSVLQRLNTFAGDALVGRPGDSADMGVLSDARRNANSGGGGRGGGGK